MKRTHYLAQTNRARDRIIEVQCRRLAAESERQRRSHIEDTRRAKVA